MGLYSVNGDFADWLVSEVGSYALSLEVGGGKEGFYPEKYEIVDLAQEPVKMMHYATAASGPYLVLDKFSVTQNCVEFVIKNEGTWKSFGPLLNLTLFLFDGNETIIEQKNQVLEPIDAFFAEKSASSCFSKDFTREVEIIEVVLSDKAHCVVSEVQTNKQNLVNRIYRTDPGYGRCDKIDKIETVYFERPAVDKFDFSSTGLDSSQDRPSGDLNEGTSTQNYGNQNKGDEIKHDKPLLNKVFDTLKGSLYIVLALVVASFSLSFAVATIVLKYFEYRDKKNRGHYKEVSLTT